MMGSSTARELVEQITRDHGHLPEETLSQMEPHIRREVEYAMLQKDGMIGSSVITLAKNLYNSSARFVFELLQNADDNSYTTAKSTDTDPYVSFSVHDRRVVVECNEDGFTRENLVAICNVGKSSKMGAQGYIGEKGIGFKSVFMVAWKVHIQSRDFSFSFRHRKGDSGMGMISPVWEETEEVLTHPLTRITLFLYDDDADEMFARQQEMMLQQFRELKATFLLFMKNLRKIEVRICDQSEEVSYTAFTIQGQQGSRVTLRQEITQDGNLQRHEQYYHTTQLTAHNIPRSENREYTDTEIATGAYARTDIILAFPLTQDSVPIIEPQEVSAFLPIRNMGLPFLIQADFVTDASRQDIVRSSARNIKLLPEIARAFMQAVNCLSTRSDLAYQWMRYLPDIGWNAQDSFWKDLPSQIYWQLQNSNVMWTRSRSGMRSVRDMRLLRIKMRDKLGRPLFPDLEPEQYLSPLYARNDLDLLRSYGLQMMSGWEYLDRLEQDINSGVSSTMRHRETDDDWHTRVAVFLISLSGLKDPEAWARIRNINLIPLMGGRWVSAASMQLFPVYFTHVQGYALPTDGIFNLVEPSAEKNVRRKRLFLLLGVREASLQDARRRIADSNGIKFPGLDNSRSHLRFLYLTAHLISESPFGLASMECELMDKESRTKTWSEGTWYFPDEGPYSPQQLLDGYDPNPLILHPHYLRDCPERPEGETRSWKTWLSAMFNIRDVIPLTSLARSLFGGGSVFGSGSAFRRLSPECLHIAKSCPNSFLSFLLWSWKTEGAEIESDPHLVEVLLKIKLLCENGRLYPLGKTYVRTAQTEHANAFLRDGEFFPWLKLNSADEAGVPDIDILTTALGFGYPKSDLEFYITILEFVADANKDKPEVVNAARIFDLYGRIQTRYHESVAREMSREMIVSAFKAKPLIYVPGHGSQTATWTFPRHCLWTAPPYMQTLYPLQARFHSITRERSLNDLFSGVLDIPNAQAHNLTCELYRARRADSISHVPALDLYQEINRRRPKMSSDAVTKLREQFENLQLIYYESGDNKRWYRPSECLWSTVTDIKGMIALNDVYEDLAEFFTEFIGVRTLTLQMVHDKLVEEGNAQCSPEQIKQTIWLLNSYMQSESDIPDPRKVLQARVFPVRHLNGAVELCSSAVDFTIADRKHLLDWFSSKAKFFDFDVNEVARLEPFLQWTGLDKRYISSSVKEISMVRGDSHRSMTSPDRNIALKAYGLLRLSVHFRSPRVRNGEQPFYEILKNIDVRETDGISSELHFNQNGKDIMVEVRKSELHFQESEQRLIVYVPRDEETQFLCFLDRIPLALIEWIMTEPLTGICEPFSDKALNVLSMVLQAEPKYVGVTLDRAGIMSVETPDDTPAEVARAIVEDTAEQNDRGRDSFNAGVTPAVSNELSPSAQSVASTPDDSMSVRFTRPSTPSPVPIRPQFTPQGTPSTTEVASPGRILLHQSIDAAYLTLLRNVVNAASASSFPSRGSFDMTALASSLDPYNEPFQLRGLDKTHRDTLIGAAGELFVFEILSRLNPALPGFSRDNWQSTIRKHVKLHEDYADLDPWNGRETADITYSDTESALTSLLIANGYLDHTWTGARPHYFLEVKSTTSTCETPFYMSRHQYERMQIMRNVAPDSEYRANVYVIFRPYNLGLDSARMKIYVNPGLMEQSGELVFTAGTWSVVPGLAV